MDTVECPYCEENVKINHDDGAHYEQDCYEEMECPLCEKHFMVSAYRSYTFDGTKADCLNDGEHDLEPIIGYGMPKEYYENTMRCRGCKEDIKIK